MDGDGAGEGPHQDGGESPILRRALEWLLGVVRDLHAAGGILLLVGLAASVIALWALAALTEEVLAGETARMDEAALHWLSMYGSDRLDLRAVEITSLGSGSTVLTLTVIVAAVLALLNRSHYAVLLAVAVGGGWILSPLLKALFDRARPQVVEWRIPYAGQASFPSGHALMGMVLYATLAYIIHHIGKRWWVSTLAIGLASVAILLTGVTRVYLGVHYPSDVLAGYAVGFSWAMLCSAVVEMMRKRETDPQLSEGAGR